MLDIAVAYNRYKALGGEFLTWLWYMLENRPEQLADKQEKQTDLSIGNRIVIENRAGSAVETITIKGDDAGLEEGKLALGKGAMVTELNLVYTLNDQKWQFTLKGESFSFTNLKTPETGPLESAEDTEAAVLEKTYLYEVLFNKIDSIFKRFITLRTSGEWEQKTVGSVALWIRRQG